VEGRVNETGINRVIGWIISSIVKVVGTSPISGGSGISICISSRMWVGSEEWYLVVATGLVGVMELV
jgi:hypothetical protein